MKIIGLTGGVGTGKSTVAGILEKKYGVSVIMADSVGHLAMEPGCETYRQIVTLFGEEIVNEKGEIDRKRLGDIVFPAPEKLESLNSIIHPFVWKKIEEFIESARREGRKAVALESAILAESGYSRLCDEIWMVTADAKVRFERLRASRGYTREKFEAIMARQLTEKEWKAVGNRIITNNGNQEELEIQLTKAMKEILLEE